MGSLLQVPPSLPKRSSDPACDKLSCRPFRDLQCIKKRHLLFLSWILFKVLYHTFKLLLCTAFWRHRLKHTAFLILQVIEMQITKGSKLQSLIKKHRWSPSVWYKITNALTESPTSLPFIYFRVILHDRVI